MEYLILVGALLLVLITGFIKIVQSGKALVNDHNFVHGYRQKFIEFVKPYLEQPTSLFGQHFAEQQPLALNWELYHWLVSNMDKTQVMLGVYGIANYSAAFGRYQASNYPYIINTIPQIRTGDADRNDLLACDDMMVRYLGAMNRSIDSEKSRLKKPFVWLQLGIQFYIRLPVGMLYWFGIISNSSFSKITSSQLFKVLAGIGGLVAFLSSLITILQGWPALKDLLK